MAIAVSNPTSASGRVTVGEALEGRYHYLRQDLSYLKAVANAPNARNPLSALERPDANIKRSLLEERAGIIKSQLPFETVAKEKYPLPEHPDLCVPVTVLQLEGKPIRPLDAKRSGNAVSLQRTFGSKHPSDLGDEVDALLATLPNDVVREALLSKVYTHGTLEGFKERIALISAEGCKSVHGVLGKTKAVRNKNLERLLPVDLDRLPNWMGGDGDLMELLRTVSISKHASAGAPYWKRKGDCMESIFHVVELVCMRMKEGKLDELLKEAPELFVIECKNKADRYDVDKLTTKTRPIFCPPAHFSLLASYLMQGFSGALHKVGGSVPTCNAYGWSAAGGGITRLVEDVKRRKANKERGWCYVYSDDGDLYIQAKGKLWRVSPDIKQMDSCVDYDAVETTWDYVLHCYEQKHGVSRFWSMVVDVLKQLFKHPRILVSGTTLYTKDPDGLLSGSVGTTLFGTVKSAACYTHMLENHSHNPEVLLNADYVAQYMKLNYGLVLKAGTWNPEIVNLEPNPAYISDAGRVEGARDALYGRGKFLGTHYVLLQGPQRADWVPWLPDEDWASCILAPREDQDAPSTTARHRLQFDRLRGYLTTGAVFSPRIEESMKYWVDRIPGEVILMQPQGTLPPEGILLGDEMTGFEYPTPEFMPNVYWVYDIYASPGNTYGLPHTKIFTDDVIARIADVRSKRRKVKLTMDAETQEMKAVPFTPNAPLTIGVELDVVKAEPQNLGSHWKGPVPQRAQQQPTVIPVPGVPYDLAYEQSERQALVHALASKPLPDFAPPSSTEVLTLHEAKRMIVDEEVNVPTVWRTGPKPSDLVHMPTPAGMFNNPPVGINADLVFDTMKQYLTKFVAIGPEIAAPSAYNKIMSGNKVTGKFTFEHRNDPITKQNVVTGSFHMSRYIHVVVGAQSSTEISTPSLCQIWRGSSKLQIKNSIRDYVIMHNKMLGSTALERKQEKDWSLGATSSKVPYSNVAQDPRPKPPAVLMTAACPTTVPVEDAAGNVTMSGAPTAPEPEPTPTLPSIPPLIIVDETDLESIGIVPPPPQYGDEALDAAFEAAEKRFTATLAAAVPTLPVTLQPYEPKLIVAPPYRGGTGTIPKLPPKVPSLTTCLDRLKRAAEAPHVVSSDEDEAPPLPPRPGTPFENVIEYTDDKNKKSYLGLSQVEEVFSYVGEWTEGNSPLTPHNTPDYQAVDFLRKLLAKTLQKLRKNAPATKEEPAKAEAPPLPPRQPKGQAPKAKEGERPERRPKWNDRGRGPVSDWGRRNWENRPRYPRTGYRPPMEQRDR